MNKIVDQSTWTAARQSLLEKEKELTLLRDEVTKARQALPWKRVETDYKFSSSVGDRKLSDLFADRNQLIVIHFMYGPGWEEGCKSCSFWADQYDALIPHLGGRDVSLAVVSRAPWQDFDAFKKRMDWQFDWLSSADNSFNTDFNVSFPDQETGNYNFRETRVMEEHPGVSVFTRNAEDEVFHTYSLYSRGLDPLNATYQLLDLVPKGRDEEALPFSMSWVQHHDRYN